MDKHSKWTPGKQSAMQQTVSTVFKHKQQQRKVKALSSSLSLLELKLSAKILHFSSSLFSVCVCVRERESWRGAALAETVRSSLSSLCSLMEIEFA